MAPGPARVARGARRPRPSGPAPREVVPPRGRALQWRPNQRAVVVCQLVDVDRVTVDPVTVQIKRSCGSKVLAVDAWEREEEAREAKGGAGAGEEGVLELADLVLEPLEEG